MKNYIRNVIDRYIRHDYPAEINRDFRSWLTNGEHSDEKEQSLHQLWDTVEAATTPEYEHSLQHMREMTGISTRRRLRVLSSHLLAWRAAAALLVVISSVAVYFALQSRPAPDVLQAYVPTAELRHVVLPDGTEVMVNSRSTLLYPQQFTGNTRSVFLVGEANFRVKRDERHPFIVKTADFQVTALGTEFNVTAYPEENEATATLISGKVLVEYGKSEASGGCQLLAPDEQFAYDRQSRTGQLNHPDMNDVTAWQRGEVVFRSLTLAEIFTRLERRYPYTFVYNYYSMKDDRFNLSFGQHASVEEIMEIISNVAGNLEYKIVGDKCYVTVKESIFK